MARWLVALCMLFAGMMPVKANDVIKVLTFNVWSVIGFSEERLGHIAAVLEASGADIIGLQEAEAPIAAGDSNARTRVEDSIAARLATRIGFHYHVQPKGERGHGANALLSRYPISAVGHGDRGMRVNAPGGTMTVFNIHLPSAPYQPYQLAGIPYDGSPDITTAEEAIAFAETARGAAIGQLERDVAAAGDGPMLIMGDFNEPSHRDWTPRAAALGRVLLPVAWPTTRRVEAMGFIDTWRAAHPNEVERPGHSWTVLPAEREVHDRIDFIFSRGPGLEVVSAAVVGEPSAASDIVVTSWPSDHRAVLATLRFNAQDRVAQKAQ